MKNRITAVVLLLAALLTGCATAEKLNNIRIGMSKDQVIALLGKPDSTSAQANIEYMTYYLSIDSSYGYSREQPYMIRLVEGKVESYGRFAQLYDLYNRPVGTTGSGQPMTMMGGPMAPYSAPMAPYPVVTPNAPDLATSLARLKALKDQGVLTEEEFQKAKQKLLSDQK